MTSATSTHTLTVRFHPLLLSVALALISGLCLESNQETYIFTVFIGSWLLTDLLVKSLNAGSTLFDPLPLTALVTLWAMVLSPVVSAYTGQYLLLPPKQIEFETWNRHIALIYLPCLLLFYVGVQAALNLKLTNTPRCFSRSRTVIFGGLFLGITSIGQVALFVSMGGLLGYMQQWTSNRGSFSGLGPVFMVTEAFPLILLFLFIILFGDRRFKHPFWVAVGLLIGILICRMIFGGLRGSRSNTIWTLFWAAGLIHVYIYKFKIHQYLAGIVALYAFMWIYTLYKIFGIDAFSGNYSLSSIKHLDTNPLISLLLTDFSRAGVNAYMLHEFFSDATYQLRHGTTYLYSSLMMIPGAAASFGFESAGKAGIELFQGNSAHAKNLFVNSRVFGLYGEGLLNFGPYVPVMLFLVAGFLIGLIHNKVSRPDASPPWKLFTPFIAYTCMTLIMSDSENIVFFIIKNGFLPILFVLLCSTRLPKQTHPSSSPPHSSP